MIEVSYERARRDPGRMEERMRLPSRSKAMAFIVVWSQVVWHGLKKYEVSRSMAWCMVLSEEVRGLQRPSGVARVESNERAQTRAILGTR